MNTELTINLLKIAGLLHLGLLCAGLMMPRVVGLKTHVGNLPPFIGHLFWVYYTFIGTCLIGFGLMTYLMAEQLAGGTLLAKAVLGFFTLFWTIRLGAAAFVFDVKPYLTSKLMRLGYWCTNLVFAYLLAVYALAWWKGN